jgi:hypothetical protein
LARIELQINGAMVDAAIAGYAYKASFGFWDDEIAIHTRYCGPKERAWDRWIKEGNEQPEYIIIASKNEKGKLTPKEGDPVYRWRTKGQWNWRDSQHGEARMPLVGELVGGNWNPTKICLSPFSVRPVEGHKEAYQRHVTDFYQTSTYNVEDLL